MDIIMGPSEEASRRVRSPMRYRQRADSCAGGEETLRQTTRTKSGPMTGGGAGMLGKVVYSWPPKGSKLGLGGPAPAGVGGFLSWLLA